MDKAAVAAACLKETISSLEHIITSYWSYWRFSKSYTISISALNDMTDDQILVSWHIFFEKCQTSIISGLFCDSLQKEKWTAKSSITWDLVPATLSAGVSEGDDRWTSLCTSKNTQGVKT